MQSWSDSRGSDRSAVVGCGFDSVGFGLGRVGSSSLRVSSAGFGLVRLGSAWFGLFRLLMDLIRLVSV